MIKFEAASNTTSDYAPPTGNFCHKQQTGTKAAPRNCGTVPARGNRNRKNRTETRTRMVPEARTVPEPKTVFSAQRYIGNQR